MRRAQERSAKRDDQIVRPRRAQTGARSVRREFAREAGRFFFIPLFKSNNIENYIKNVRAPFKVFSMVKLLFVK